MKSGIGKIFLKFLHALTESFLLLNFDQKNKFSNKNNMVSAWRNFKNIFPRPLFIIIFRPEMLKFHPFSILTGDTRVEFVIYILYGCAKLLFSQIKCYLNFPLNYFYSHLIVFLVTLTSAQTKSCSCPAPNFSSGELNLMKNFNNERSIFFDIQI